MVVDGLNSLGIGKPIEGLSVVMNFEVIERSSGVVGIRTLCVGFGLDPLQASYLLDLARSDPDAFFDLESEKDRFFHLSSVDVVPDMYLSAVNATIAGRDGKTYDRLVAATTSKKQYLNA